jgi:dTDP-4-amino-4,6-dideoxygalactose transaminase
VSLASPLIPRQRANVRQRDLLRAARISRGSSRREELLRRLRALTEHEHVVPTASGRGALLALLATCGRDRAVIPGYTCKAVVEAARIAGIAVELVDVSDGFNWTPQDLEPVVGAGDVVVVTHQFGIPGDVEGQVAVARGAGALVVEDCAAALGGRWRGRRLGSFGDAAFYSFDMSKLVHVPPKAGALTVADGAWAEAVQDWMRRETRALTDVEKARALGQASVLAATDRPIPYRGLHTAMLARRGLVTTDTSVLDVERNWFYDGSLAEWQAELALPQLERVDALAADARRRYRRYRDALEGSRRFELPPADTDQEWAPIRFPLRIRGDKIAYYEELLAHGVDCAFSFTHIARRDGLPRSAALADAVLDLPFYPRLSDTEQDRVIAAVRELERA